MAVAGRESTPLRAGAAGGGPETACPTIGSEWAEKRLFGLTILVYIENE
jgi:hypothetical protein